MAIAVFDYAAWQTMYPALSTTPEIVAQSYFDLAGFYLDNSDCSPVPVGPRLTLLNMIVAHLVAVFGGVPGQSASGMVGRVEEATEGSVRVKLAEIKGMDSVAGSFFAQTPYGLAFWAATSSLRRYRYVPRPDPNYEPIGFGWGGGYGRYR